MQQYYYYYYSYYWRYYYDTNAIKTMVMKVMITENIDGKYQNTL